MDSQTQELNVAIEIVVTNHFLNPYYKLLQKHKYSLISNRSDKGF